MGAEPTISPCGVPDEGGKSSDITACAGAASDLKTADGFIAPGYASSRVPGCALYPALCGKQLDSNTRRIIGRLPRALRWYSQGLSGDRYVMLLTCPAYEVMLCPLIRHAKLHYLPTRARY